MILKFNKEVVSAEDILKASGTVERTLVVAFQEGLLDHTAQTPRCSYKAAAVLLKQLPVHARLVVVPLQERAASELQQIAIPGVVFCEQRQVVVKLCSLISVTP